jgi:hypothetical protein
VHLVLALDEQKLPREVPKHDLTSVAVEDFRGVASYAVNRSSEGVLVLDISPLFVNSISVVSKQLLGR